MRTFTLAGSYSAEAKSKQYIIYARHGAACHIDPVDAAGRRLTGGMVVHQDDLRAVEPERERIN